MDSATPGERLRWFRESYRRLSARAMANLISSSGFSITHSTLLRYERGDTQMTGDFLLALQSAVGISPEWLLTGTGQAPTPAHTQGHPQNGPPTS